MPEMYLRQPGIRYSRCGPFTKNKERIQKFKEAGYSRYIYQNEQEKGWIQHDVASGDFKDFPNQTVSDFYLIKHYPRYNGYQSGITSIFYKCFNKKTSDAADKGREF